MKYLFTPEGEAALQNLVQQETLYGFDFDGTLAPIVLTPEQARMSPAIARSLGALNEVVSVAILTGRGLVDIQKRLDVQPLPRYLVGNHGVEGLPGADVASECRDICNAWFEQLKARFVADQADSNLLIEDKTYSLSLHYRLARDREQAAQYLDEVITSLDPQPKVIGGKCVVNLLPAEAPDKGTAFIKLLELEGMQSAFYIGDDETDEAVFRIAPTRWLTVRVGYSKDSKAQFFLHHQGEVASCLQTLRRLVTRAQEGGVGLSSAQVRGLR